MTGILNGDLYNSNPNNIKGLPSRRAKRAGKLPFHAKHLENNAIHSIFDPASERVRTCLDPERRLSIIGNPNNNQTFVPTWIPIAP